MSDIDYSKLKVSDLKLELKKRGLSVDGKKSELIERLQLSQADSSLLDDNHDDLLDEDVLSDEEVLNETLDTPPPTDSKSLKRPADTDIANTKNTKKIVLNRAVVLEPIELGSEPETPTATVVEAPVVDATPAPEITKLTGLTEMEKLEKRAARFGVAAPATATADATKDSRSIRFGATAATPQVTKTPNLDLLKKRAERFGTVAPVLEKVELEERKKKRLERFGSTSVPASVVKSSENAPASIDKKLQRAERFQIKT